MKPFLAFFNMGATEWVVIGVIVLIVFGPRRLPEIADAFGKSITRFKSATRSATSEVKRELDEAAREVRSAGEMGDPPDNAPPAGDIPNTPNTQKSGDAEPK
jgi:sec-independent protein translocase protein TatA